MVHPDVLRSIRHQRWKPFRAKIAEGGDPWNGNHWYHQSCTASVTAGHALERLFCLMMTRDTRQKENQN